MIDRYALRLSHRDDALRLLLPQLEPTHVLTTYNLHFSCAVPFGAAHFLYFKTKEPCICTDSYTSSMLFHGFPESVPLL